MLPPVDATGNLPPGVHTATWAELEAHSGTTPQRSSLLGGLRRALLALQAAGCRRAYVDGSFVTSKVIPNDFDGCWDPVSVDPALLDPTLLQFGNKRMAQKAKYGGELFPSSAAADRNGNTFLQFFQIDKHTGAPKGIVAIDLTGAAL